MRLAMLCLIASVFTSRAVWDAIRRRSSFAFYIAAAVVMWLMTLGPTMNLLQKEILPTAPYALLLHIPGWPGLRVPARFAMLMVLCVAIAAALAYSRVTKTASPSRRALLTSTLTLALLG